MVNHGRSGGCNTCRKRRVKCDQARPVCQVCQRSSRECLGYERSPPGLRFKDQTSKLQGKFEHVRKTNDSLAQHHNDDDGDGPPAPEDGCPPPATGPGQKPADPDETQRALEFFFTYMTGGGRSVSSGRGLFEVIPPAMASEPDDSPLSLAVVAVATWLWRRKQHHGSITSPHPPFVSACQRLHAAIQDPVEKTREATVLAALVLQFYENLSAVFGLYRAEHIHTDGAEALLNVQAVAENVQSRYRSFILGYLLHTKVSFAIRSKTRVPGSMYSWLQDGVFTARPGNPSRELDMIGVSVAHHQHRFSEFVPASGAMPAFFNLEEWWAEILETEVKLHKWLKTVPDSWQPTRRWSGRDFDPSVSSFSEACDIYPSAQIASVWNVSRCYRLILLKIKLALLHVTSTLAVAPQATYPQSLAAAAAAEDGHRFDNEVTGLVDSICYSVPFYLGNTTESIKASEFESDSSIFPSHHDLPPDNEEFLRYANSDYFMTRKLHIGHILMQGPWHVMTPLARLLSLFSEDFGDLLVRSLRPGQRDWIRGQILRVATLLRLSPEYGSHTLPTDPDLRSMAAEAIARTIREGLRMSSGT